MIRITPRPMPHAPCSMQLEIITVKPLSFYTPLEVTIILSSFIPHLPSLNLTFRPCLLAVACQPPAQRSRPIVSPPPVPAAVRAGIVPRATVLVSAERQAREILSALCSALGSAAKSNVTALATLGAPVSDGSIVLGALFSPAAALALATASAATLKTPALPAGIIRCVVLAVLLP